tara:strand:+ start:1226 stop:1357 length:132 start_codon:yes stop_codon:yes gene_type:complete
MELKFISVVLELPTSEQLASLELFIGPELRPLLRTCWLQGIGG